MLTSYDFSAMDRVALLQKATELVMNAGYLKQTFLEKGHVYDPRYLGPVSHMETSLTKHQGRD